MRIKLYNLKSSKINILKTSPPPPPHIFSHQILIRPFLSSQFLLVALPVERFFPERENINHMMTSSPCCYKSQNLSGFLKEDIVLTLLRFQT